MWIVKGLALGSTFFVIGTILYLYLAVIHPSHAQATGLTVIQGLTVQNIFFWVALVACLALGLCFSASWPNRIPS